MMDTDEMGQKSNNSKNNFSFWIPAKRNKIHVATKSKLAATTFLKSLRVTLIIGQGFSLVPVVGLMSNNASDVKFIRWSWKVFYSIVSFFGQLFMTAMCLYRVILSDSSLKGTTPVIFYGTTFITMLMFLQVARTWPDLVQHISRTEDIDPNFDSRLTYRCNITCAVVLILALLEHILSLLSAYAGAMVCYPNKSLYEGFARHSYPWVFNFLPYSMILGIVMQIFRTLYVATMGDIENALNAWSLYIGSSMVHMYKRRMPKTRLILRLNYLCIKNSTFIWNFSDLFVICISYYLTSRLEQVNKKLLAAQGKYLPEVFWRTLREDYCRVTQLVRRVDDVISGIIFMSFANNLFFICLQLFNTLEDGIKGTGECSSRARGITHRTPILGGYEAAVYFVFSLVFLIGRSIAVSLIASQVNTASNVPAPVLYDVPSPVYCVEVQRFLDQVNGDLVALSGLRFFNVTRGLLLTVAGTIVTYELVMVQFNSPSPHADSMTATPFTSTPTP